MLTNEYNYCRFEEGYLQGQGGPLFLECFDSEGWYNTPLRNVGKYLPVDTAQHPKRLYFQNLA